MYKKKAAKRVAAGAKTSFDRKPANGRAARYKVVGAARGYQQTSGFYGRFASNGSAGAELKFHDVALDDAVVTANGALTASINLIPQGVTEKTRVGRKCVIRRIAWRFDITMNDTATADNTSEVFRVILYQDKQCNGATATVVGLLETDDYQSFNNLANSGRFKVLMDRTYDMNCPAGASVASPAVIFGEQVIHDSFYKMCEIPLEFDSTTGAITEIRSNNLGVILLTKAGNLTTFASQFRLRFSDGS